jgi:hypothetical protein
MPEGPRLSRPVSLMARNSSLACGVMSTMRAPPPLWPCAFIRQVSHYTGQGPPFWTGDRARAPM